MDQDPSAQTRPHEIDDIRATAVVRATASVNHRGERVEPLSPDMENAVAIGWKCLPHETDFLEWAAVEKHLRETVNIATNQGSQETSDNEADTADLLAQPDDEPQVETN